MKERAGSQTGWRLQGIQAALELAEWWTGEERRQRANLERNETGRQEWDRKQAAYDGWTAACAALEACWAGARSLLQSWTPGPDTDEVAALHMDTWKHRYLVARHRYREEVEKPIPKGGGHWTQHGWRMPGGDALEDDGCPWVKDDPVASEVGEAAAKQQAPRRAPWLPEELHQGARKAFAEAIRRGPGLKVKEEENGTLVVEEWRPGKERRKPIVTYVLPDGTVQCAEGEEEPDGRYALRWAAFQGTAKEEEGELTALAESFRMRFPVVLLASGGGYPGEERYPEILQAERSAREKVRARIGKAGQVLGKEQCNAAALAQITRHKEGRRVLEKRPNLARWWGARCTKETKRIVRKMRRGAPLLKAMGGGEDEAADLAEAVEGNDCFRVEEAMGRIIALARGPVVDWWSTELTPGRAGLVWEDPVAWCERVRSKPRKLLEMEEALAMTLGRDGDPEGKISGWVDYQAYRPGRIERVLARAMWRAVKGGRKTPSGILHVRDMLRMVGDDLCRVRWAVGVPAGIGIEHKAAEDLERSGIRTWKDWRTLTKAVHDPRWMAKRRRKLRDGDRRFLKELDDPRAPKVNLEIPGVVQIRDAEELAEEGERMEHCVGLRLGEMVAGRSVLLHVGPAAPGGATLELEIPTTCMGWFDEREIQAAGNKEPGEEEREAANAVRETLRKWWHSKTTAERRSWISGRVERNEEVRRAMERQGRLGTMQRALTLWSGLYDQILPEGMCPGIPPDRDGTR